MPMDIAELLRQRQIIDQLNQTTAQGTQAAMIHPGIAQFNTPAGPDPTQIMDSSQPRAPQPGQPGGIMPRIAGGIGNFVGSATDKIGGLFSGGQKPVMGDTPPPEIFDPSMQPPGMYNPSMFGRKPDDAWV